jgi:hypothetical protein
MERRLLTAGDYGEPWRPGPDGGVVSDVHLPGGQHSDLRTISWYGGHLVCESIGPTLSRRVILAVNACRGIPNEQLELGAIFHAVAHLRMAERLLRAGAEKVRNPDASMPVDPGSPWTARVLERDPGYALESAAIDIEKFLARLPRNLGR